MENSLNNFKHLIDKGLLTHNKHIGAGRIMHMKYIGEHNNEMIENKSIQSCCM